MFEVHDTFDTMSWIIEEEDMNKLVVILESTERNEKKIFKLNLMDLDDEKYEIEPVQFPYELLSLYKIFTSIAKIWRQLWQIKWIFNVHQIWYFYQERVT